MYEVSDVAELLHMSYRGVLLLIKQERIKAVRIGKKYLISKDEIDRVLREGV
jgi:excisionase family DNA binding protein